MASDSFQEEVKNLPTGGCFSDAFKAALEPARNPNNLNMISRRTRGVVSKVQLHSGGVSAERKDTFAGKKGNIISIMRETEILKNIRHRNIVKMPWYSFDKNYGIIWHEDMPNGNLHDVLYEKNPPPSLEWNIRYRIAVGIAHGLAYLHYDFHPAIVHGAIKSRNILLDSDMEPQIADFGFAQFVDQSSSTPSSSVPVTPGYITPANTQESDVYSYGIVLLQLITRKVVDPAFMDGTEMGIWVRTRWRETGDINAIVDSRLAEEVLNSDVLEQVTKVLFLALSCTEMDPYMRPTMKDVINHLEDP